MIEPDEIKPGVFARIRPVARWTFLLIAVLAGSAMAVWLR
jgi:hypothetical protein